MLDNMGWRIERHAHPFARWLPPLPARSIRASIWPIWARAGHLSADTHESERCSGSPRMKRWLGRCRRSLDHLPHPAQSGAPGPVPDFAQTRAHALASPLTTISPAIIEARAHHG
jgi:hypothetical protein